MNVHAVNLSAVNQIECMHHIYRSSTKDETSNGGSKEKGDQDIMETVKFGETASVQ